MSEAVGGPVTDPEAARALAYQESLRRRAAARRVLLAKLSGSRSARNDLADRFAPVVKRPEGHR